MMEQPAVADPGQPTPVILPAPQPRGGRAGRIAVAFLVAVLLLAVVAATVLYATDYQVEATVQEVDCTSGRVLVETKLLAIEHAVTGVPVQQCLLLRPGNFVEYHVRSERTRLWDVEGGDCIYDSATGAC